MTNFPSKKKTIKLFFFVFIFYSNHINDSNSIKSQILLSITHQIIKGINFLHSYRIIHRDIKHTNILINNN